MSVTDLVTTAGPDGLRTRLSAYAKLRLAPADVAVWAAAAGLTLRSSFDQGLVVQVFRATGLATALHRGPSQDAPARP